MILKEGNAIKMLIIFSIMMREDMMNRSMDLSGNRNRPNLSDTLHSTFNTSFLGLGPPSNAYMAMMEAKFEKDQKKL